MSETDSRVKADWNCLLQILFLSFASILRIPFSLCEAIANAPLFLRDLTNYLNFFHALKNRDQNCCSRT